jgi:tetratricopeptide (TPR) repeat protein
MKREQKVKTPALARGKKARPSPKSEEAWSALRRNLAAALGSLDEDEYLVIASKTENYFVQFAGQGAQGMRAEAVSNAFITTGAPLSDTACQALLSLGWNAPTYVPSKGAAEPTKGSCNFYLDAGTPVPHARLAALAVRTLRRIYGIRHPGELEYRAFGDRHISIRFPLLDLRREPRASAGSGSDTLSNQEEDLVRTPGVSSVPTFKLPDGQPIASTEVEASLRSRLAKCEEALEDAVWELARFYSLVGRQPDARVYVNRLMAWTANRAKVVGGYLALGQLLEQEERFAEAEVAYAKGLEVLPPCGEVGYFLQNNRGYCLNILGRYQEAEGHCRAAIAIAPTRFNAHKNLGLALAGQGRYVEAACALLEADRRCLADGRARRHLFDLLSAHPELLKDSEVANACEALRLLGETGRVGSA